MGVTHFTQGQQAEKKLTSLDYSDLLNNQKHFSRIFLLSVNVARILPYDTFTAQ